MIREIVVWMDTKFGFSKKKFTLRPRKYKGKQKMVAKEPYEGYKLPKSSKKGQSFIDWNEVIKESVGLTDKQPIKKVKKRR